MAAPTAAAPLYTLERAIEEYGLYRWQCRLLARVIAWQRGDKVAVGALDAEDADTGLS